MLKDKVSNFYDLYDDFFLKKKKIAELMYEIEETADAANAALKATIDNGLCSKDLFDVKLKYDKSKFNSQTVQNFIKQIDEMLFSSLEPKLKNRLEVVELILNVYANSGINFNYTSGDRGFWTNGPVQLDFADKDSARCFSVSIPVKDSVRTDVFNWKTQYSGIYVVSALNVNDEENPFNNDRYKVICSAFDKSKVVEAVKMYLTGDFDEKMKTVVFLPSKWKDWKKMCELEDVNSSHFMHDCLSFGDIASTEYMSSRVEDCIDDRNEYGFEV